MVQPGLLCVCLLVICLQLSTSRSADDVNNNTPIVGVVMQANIYHDEIGAEKEYIESNYVKYIESAGGRVVPIFNNLTDAEMDGLFHSINGVLFPGGDVPLIISPYYHTAERIYKLALKANDEGDYFPLWGTCLGFQMLLGLRVGSDSILSHSNAVGLSVPLNLTTSAHNSRIFSKATQKTMHALATEQLTYNSHHNCVTPEEFENSKLLKDFFDVLSTNTDRDGKVFISTVEAFDYPFYGVQWHPEKNGFETTRISHVNHSEDAVVMMQTMANMFVSETRKNRHRFANREEEIKHLIQNYCPSVFHHGKSYDEVYLF